MTPTDLSLAIPTLETERLLLRGPRPEDFDAYAAFYASAQADGIGGRISRTTAWGKFAGLLGHWSLRGFGRWLVFRRADGVYCGHLGLLYPEGWPEREIAWSVTAEAQGQGIAFEAATAARRYAYDRLGWRTAVSLVAPENTRSARLAERLGAVCERVLDDLDGDGPVRVFRHPSPEALREAAA